MKDLYGKKTALVIVDAQRKFCSDRPDWESARNKAVSRMNRLMYYFRQAGAPVFVIQYEGECRCRPYEGDDGDEYFPGLAVRPFDRVVVKRNMNSFKDTDLEDVVKSYGCDMILLCGTVTQYCVMSTYFAAMDRGLIPYLAHGATISTADEILEAAEKVCKTLDEDVVCPHLGVERLPDDTVPVMVENVLPEWDDSRICDTAALANTDGGHFVIGYPKGLKDSKGLAEKIRSKVKEQLGIVIEANPITFCAHDSVDVVVPKSDDPVIIGGQKFKAVAGFSY